MTTEETKLVTQVCHLMLSGMSITSLTAEQLSNSICRMVEQQREGTTSAQDFEFYDMIGRLLRQHVQISELHRN